MQTLLIVIVIGLFLGALALALAWWLMRLDDRRYQKRVDKDCLDKPHKEDFRNDKGDKLH